MELWLMIASRDVGEIEEHHVLEVWADYVGAQREAERRQDMLDVIVPGIGITVHVSGPWELHGLP